MTEVSFYHLTKTPLEKALPQLLLKVLESGKHGVLVAKDEEQLNYVNDFLWTFSTKKVVPHGTKSQGFVEEQPIYLSTEEENPNNAEMLILVGGVEPKFTKEFSRCLDVFDGNNDEETKQARARWKKYKEDPDLTLTYWKQNDKGNWEKA